MSKEQKYTFMDMFPLFVIILIIATILGVRHTNKIEAAAVDCRYEDHKIDEEYYTQNLMDQGLAATQSEKVASNTINTYRNLPTCWSACKNKVENSSDHRVEFYLDDHSDSIPCEKWVNGELKKIN